MNRFPSLLKLIVLVLAFALLTAACDGGSSTLTIEEYFQQLEEIDKASVAEEEALEAQFDIDLGNATSNEETLALFRDFAGAGSRLIDDFIDDLVDLSPPDEIEAAHDEALKTLRAFGAVSQDLLDDIAGAADLEAAQALYEDDELTQTFRASSDACLELERIAINNGIEIDLECNEDST